MQTESKSMDYFDKRHFWPRAAYHNTSMMWKTLRGHCNVGDKCSVEDSVATSGDKCGCSKAIRRERDDIRVGDIQP